MRSNFVTLLAAVAFSLGSVAMPASESTNNTLVAQASIDCKGSSHCRSMNVGQCDAAYRTIVPSNVYGTNGAAGNTGVCNGHCGIFVRGSNCQYNGQALQDAYNDLRSNGCRVCGSYHFNNGCLITINYVTGC